MTIPKFRVWDKVKKHMSEVEAIVYTENKVYPFYSKVVRRYIPFKESVLMQSIGLKDVNGKEIFEGDLLRAPFEEDGLFEVYLDVLGGFYTRSVLTGKIQFVTIDDLDNLSKFNEMKAEFIEALKESVEVIGNIYENPELLKAQ